MYLTKIYKKCYLLHMTYKYLKKLPQTMSKVQEAHKKGINMIEKHRILAFFTPFMLLKNSFNTIYPVLSCLFIKY